MQTLGGFTMFGFNSLYLVNNKLLQLLKMFDCVNATAFRFDKLFIIKLRYISSFN